MTILDELIQQHTAPMRPVPTDVSAVLETMRVKAVLFDVYGTLLISDSGDIGSQRQEKRISAAKQTFASYGAEGVDAEVCIERLSNEVETRHEQLRSTGIDYPEVNIVDVWKSVLTGWEQLTSSTDLDVERWEQSEWEQFAFTYELLANPVWPMPGAKEVLHWVSSRTDRMGIVSNAQFYTPMVMQQLFDQSLEQLGFERDLQVYSFQHSHAKPGVQIYRMAVDMLEAYSIKPDEAVFVGNDMLNDIAAASQVGFRTVLFAGDGRSLRWRKDDPRLRDVRPDAVITELSQLQSILGKV